MKRVLTVIGVLVAVAALIVVGLVVFVGSVSSPTPGPFYAEAAPPRHAPVLITQGEPDMLVRPAVTAAFDRRLCAQGETVDYRAYPGVDHIHAGPKTAPDVVRWIADRFAGETVPSKCGGRVTHGY